MVIVASLRARSYLYLFRWQAGAYGFVFGYEGEIPPHRIPSLGFLWFEFQLSLLLIARATNVCFTKRMNEKKKSIMTLLSFYFLDAYSSQRTDQAEMRTVKFLRSSLCTDSQW